MNLSHLLGPSLVHMRRPVVGTVMMTCLWCPPPMNRCTLITSSLMSTHGHSSAVDYN